MAKERQPFHILWADDEFTDFEGNVLAGALEDTKSGNYQVTVANGYDTIKDSLSLTM